MSRKTCLITGATSGIGRATALELGRLGWDLWLAGRDKRRGESMARVIERLGKGGRARFIATDVSSLREVRALANAVRAETRHLDVLVNNAGARIMSFGRSADGIELTFATNHLGHFLLTLLLLDLLSLPGAGRVVNVSSGAHRAGRGDFEGVLGGRPYDGRKAYAEAKLANVLFTREFSRRLQGASVTAYAADPGGVATRFALNNGIIAWLRHCVAYARHGTLLTPRQGCRTIVALATLAAENLSSGGYYFDSKEVQSSKQAQNEHLSRKLWDLSVTLSGINPAESVASVVAGPPGHQAVNLL